LQQFDWPPLRHQIQRISPRQLPPHLPHHLPALLVLLRLPLLFLRGLFAITL
jgi:hypothetical protein